MSASSSCHKLLFFYLLNSQSISRCSKQLLPLKLGFMRNSSPSLFTYQNQNKKKKKKGWKVGFMITVISSHPSLGNLYGYNKFNTNHWCVHVTTSARMRQRVYYLIAFMGHDHKRVKQRSNQAIKQTLLILNHRQN